MRFTALALRCGPDPAEHRALITIELSGGHLVRVPLDVAHARALASRLDEIISGRVLGRPPSRRDLDLELMNEAEAADTLPPPPMAVGGDR